MATSRSSVVLGVLALTALFSPAAASCSVYYDYSYDEYYEQIIHPDQPCPSMCECDVCSYHVEVNCDNRNLARVPLNVSDFTSKITLNNNYFPILDYNSFPEKLRKGHGWAALFTLEMRNSSVREIHENTFAGLSDLEMIDLSYNNIKVIKEGAFNDLPHLMTLKLDYNNLTHTNAYTFGRLPGLQQLFLNNNTIVQITKDSFISMTELQELYLHNNAIKRLGKGTFNGLSSLKRLKLDGNMINDIWAKVFDDTPKLRVLTLNHNRLTAKFLTVAFTKNSKVTNLSLENNVVTALNASTLRYLPWLEELDLSLNKITRIDDFSFKGMHHLRYLRLSFNRILTISENFFDASAINLGELYLDNQLLLNGSRLSRIHPQAFRHLMNVTRLHLNRNNLSEFDDGLFRNMKSLVILQCEFNQFLHTFPRLEGAPHVEKIYLHMTDIQVIPHELCTWLPNIRELDVAVSSVVKIPDFHGCKQLMHLYLSTNLIASHELEGKLTGLDKLMDLTLYSNKLTMITNSTFAGLTSLEHLDLHNNPIANIWSGAFASFQWLKELNLKNTQFTTLPTAGLSTVEALFLIGNTDMIVFPEIKHFPKLRIALLNYPYHCCMWKEFMPKQKETTEDVDDMLLLNPVPVAGETYSYNGDGFVHEGDGIAMHNPTASVDYSYSQGSVSTVDYESDTIYPTLPPRTLPLNDNRVVKCEPHPNALTPCDDLLEHWWLRLFVWLFMVIALAANAVVFFIIMTTRSRQAAAQTARFFVTFLAIADFSLGLYLAFIAFVDVLTTGEYAQHALKWKVSTSCKASGFFAIFGSVLSIWTLTAITLDRLLAVTFAVRRFKISKTKAWGVMGFGVMAAIVIAVLPLVGVSRYTNVGVCLPFDISTSAAKVYVTFLLILPLVAVLIISCSYFKLYRMYSHSSAWNASETRVAFRVALLVFFNCACWVPIAVIGLLVIYGNRDDILQTSVLDGNNSGKISLFVAKVLVAIFFPINAVFDPFFYAISTPYFRRDITNLLKKIKTKIQKINIGRSLVSSRSRRPSVSSGPNRQLPLTRGASTNNQQAGGNLSGSPDLSSRVGNHQVGQSVQTRDTMLSPHFKNVCCLAVDARQPAETLSVDSASRNVQPNMSASDTSNSTYNINLVQTIADTHNNSTHHLSATTSTPQHQCVSLTDNSSQLNVNPEPPLDVQVAALPSHSSSESQQDILPSPPRPRTVQFKNSTVQVCDHQDPDLYMAQETSV